MIYFIKEAEETGYYKIGFTGSSILGRRRGLSTGNPRELEVICVFRGSVEQEKQIHAALGRFRKQGEWFQLTNDEYALVVNLLSVFGEAIPLENANVSSSNAEPISESGEPPKDFRGFLETEWRIEVIKNGRYWNWRKGSGKNRQCRWGGRFSELPIHFRKDYEVNKEKEARRRELIRARVSGEKISGQLEYKEDASTLGKDRA